MRHRRTVKDGVIEIQGDQRETLVDLLTKQGFKVKQLAGKDSTPILNPARMFIIS